MIRVEIDFENELEANHFITVKLRELGLKAKYYNVLNA